MSLTKITPASASRCAAKKGLLWCVKDRHADGRPVHQHFKLEAKAKELENRLRAERVGGDLVVTARRLTFRDYAEQWRQAMTWKDNDGPRYALNRAYKVIGDHQLAAVDGLALQGLQRQLFDHGYTRASVEQSMHFVKRALQRAHADGRIVKDPTIGVRLPRRDSLDTQGKVTAGDVPTVAEAIAIVQGAPLEYRAAVALGIGCGLRVSEVLGLTPNRVDLRAGTITVDRQFQRGKLDSPKTWRGVRTIEPPDFVMTELRRAVHDSAPPDLPIFTGGRGATLRRDAFYLTAWRPALVAAGIDARRYKFHAARHFAVSNMLSHGVSPIEVAAYVGDAPETILSTYAHFLRESKSLAKMALDVTFTEGRGEALRDKFATGD